MRYDTDKKLGASPQTPIDALRAAFFYLRCARHACSEVRMRFDGCAARGLLQSALHAA
jgi:hypothetical protein